MLFASCSKDVDDPSDLVYGTTWEAQELDMLDPLNTTYVVINFNTRKTCEIYIIRGTHIIQPCGIWKYNVCDGIVYFQCVADGIISKYYVKDRFMMLHEHSMDCVYGNHEVFVKQ